MILTTEKLRTINRELIQQHLRLEGSGNKTTISKATGLSISTCRTILNEMLLSGEIFAEDKVSSNGGRPSVVFSYNKDFAYIGIVALGRVSNKITLLATVHNLFNDELYRIEESFKKLDYIVLKNIIDNIYSKFPKIEVFSIGVPGIVINGFIDAADVKDIEGIDLKNRLESDFNIKFVIENDLNAAALGYYNNKLSENCESFAYLYFPELGNPGAGIVINGKVIAGKSNFAGEVGYLPSAPSFDAQGELQNILEQFLPFIKHIILSINTIINPEKLIISWTGINEDVIKDLENLFSEYKFKHHLPEISYNTNLNIDYISGLSYLGIKELSCKIGVIEG